MPGATILTQAAEENDAAPAGRPLIVDLDGTLIKTDILAESFFALLGQRPLRALASLAALRFGRAAFKERIAEHAVVDLNTLPVNDELIAFLRAEKARGRALYLATAAHRSYAEAIAARLGLFDGVLASDGVVNLRGGAKAKLLCDTFAEGQFDYAGNARPDLKVWDKARRILIVNASRGLTRAAQRRFPDATVLAPRTAELSDYGRALRPGRWVKNLLVFVPAFAAHKFEMAAMLASLLAFCSFSLCASSAYLLNDLLDLRSDREHPVKRRRPLASGQINIAHGIILCPVLLLLSLGLGELLLPWRYGLTLCVYFGLTLGYAIAFKRMVIIDVVTLGGLYGTRLVAGAAAAQAALSPWIIAFAVFMFLSLALIRRWAESEERVEPGNDEPAGRRHRRGGLAIIRPVAAAASGCIAVLVSGLYIHSPAAGLAYRHPEMLWIIPPALFCWISRLLILTRRGEMPDDPVVFAAKDAISLLCGAATIVAVAAGL